MVNCVRIWKMRWNPLMASLNLKHFGIINKVHYTKIYFIPCRPDYILGFILKVDIPSSCPGYTDRTGSNSYCFLETFTINTCETTFKVKHIFIIFSKKMRDLIRMVLGKLDIKIERLCFWYDRYTYECH